jgi:hypothetical protein
MRTAGPLSSLIKSGNETWPLHLLKGAGSRIQVVSLDEFEDLSALDLQDKFRLGSILVRGSATNAIKGCGWSHETLGKIVPPGVFSEVQRKSCHHLKSFVS